MIGAGFNLLVKRAEEEEEESDEVDPLDWLNSAADKANFGADKANLNSAADKANVNSTADKANAVEDQAVTMLLFKGLKLRHTYNSMHGASIFTHHLCD